MINELPASNSFYALAEETTRIVNDADSWIDNPEISDDADAIAAGDLVRLITAHLKDIDEARKVETKPLDETKAEIQARYKPLLDRCLIAKSKVAALIQDYMRRQRDESRQAALDAANAAQASWLEAEKEIAAARGVDALAAAQSHRDEALRLIDEASQQALLRVHVGSNAGDTRAMTLRRTPAKARVTDLRRVVVWAFRHRKDELAGAVEQIATKAARGGVTNIPGVEIYRSEVVA